MFRFSIEDQEWILRFAPNIVNEEEMKKEIVSSILFFGENLAQFAHGESFVMMTKNIGLIVFHVEKIPSLILTVSTIVPENKWYVQKNHKIEKYKSGMD